ncbi:hypothetical protein H6G41_02485 [Tolypothrix sp. FACHB-123]|uniref:hypothetical protein n=1 Tax=Tolypothrix sp. FACHB-123 TaxID=2692868 RepID=UPI0016857DB1|nr:hypothetical protein [Tolypothrix sp. FACHB-123]MBD2353498.1 hypothetical protein [Tolypothrix sp. FACHB-123]
MIELLFAPTDLVKIIYQTISLTNPQYLYHASAANYILTVQAALPQRDVEVTINP